ncbi:hypothetical protein Tco_0631611 [Tanacetum coccineum]
MNSQRELNPFAPPFYTSRFNHHHASITNRTNKWSVHFPVATGPRSRDEDKEVDYEILDKKYPIIDWKTENLGTKPQFDESKRSEEINMNVVTRNKIPEGFDKVLWGDLIVMFNPDEQDEFWNSQHEWKVVSWKLHSSSGVHTLMTDEGLVVHMLIEKKYPLKKEIVVQMLKLKLESEEESTMALELIRFIKKGSQLTLLLGEELASPNTNDEELSIPEQTATGKGTSNPLMADKDAAKEG